MDNNSITNPSSQQPVVQMPISSPSGGLNVSTRLPTTHTIPPQATHLLGHDYVAENAAFSTSGVRPSLGPRRDSVVGGATSDVASTAVLRAAVVDTTPGNRHPTPMQQSNQLPNGNVLSTSNHHTLQQIPASPQQIQNLQQQMHHHHQLQQHMAFQQQQQQLQQQQLQQQQHLDLAIQLQAAHRQIALQQLQAQQLQQYQAQHQVQQEMGLSRLAQIPAAYPGSVASFVSSMEQHAPPQLSQSDVLQGLEVTDNLIPEDVKSEPCVADQMDKSSMTWLKAAEQVLSAANRPMHIKEIKQQILGQGLIQSNARTSLESILYRDAQKPKARFTKVDGHLGMFKLLSPEEKKWRSENYQVTKTTQKNQPKESENERYSKRFRKLRKVAKSMIFENAALCDEICRTEEKIIRVMEERKLLLKRVLKQQALRQANALHAGQSINTSVKNASPGPSSDISSRSQDSASKKDGKIKNKSKNKHKKDRDKSKDRKHMKDKKTESRSKTKKSNPSRKLVQPITLDASGRPVFPIVLGDLTVHSLGDVIIDRPGFHSDKYIYPVGYCSSRTFVSVKDPDVMCLYTCKILDGVTGPRFEIVSDDKPGVTFEANSASLAHAALLKAVNNACGREVVSESKGSGPAFFGFSKPTIQNLIQSSPGPRKYTNYKWMKFDICKQDERSSVFDQSMRDPAINFQAYQNARRKSAPSEINLRNLLTDFNPSILLDSRLLSSTATTST
ncbi:general transcriptional corepressor CYC8-like [Anneissia japonica]|uniref:general transcriptional corepressor CYC8-like n=1 Tax=Anneissia japonica TaxID=1529436 RepID=UPI00142574DD|nr:general transcriptional corepressor CYC8-like [Anneissia japonica]